MSKRAASPKEKYQSLIEAKSIQPDPGQMQAVERLEALWFALEQKPSFLQRLLGRSTDEVKGLYLWGGVGRGKTFLMDLFFQSVTGVTKQRQHFHRFMFNTHEQLKRYAGLENPLEKIAADIAKSSQLLCFDEFFVTDIADAMILGGLLDGLFRRNVVLVATSNIQPSDLYANGLQRQRFVPAIDWISRCCDIYELKSDADYRLRALEQAEIYHAPLDEKANVLLKQSFSALSNQANIRPDNIVINHRDLVAKARADGVIWFDFKILCQSNRSASDYIELSRLFHSVLISDVPQMNDDLNDAVRRFIILVDEFYERQVKLILSAETSLDSLYRGERLAFEFARTQSRLIEMQSKAYLARPHLSQ